MALTRCEMLFGQEPRTPTLRRKPFTEVSAPPTLFAMPSDEDLVAPTLCAMPCGEDPVAPTLGVMPSDETVEIMEKAVPALFYTIPMCLSGSAGF
jgi:hypothetical protein